MTMLTHKRYHSLPINEVIESIVGDKSFA